MCITMPGFSSVDSNSGPSATEQAFVNRPISLARLRALQSPLAGVNNVGSKEKGTGDHPRLLSCCWCPWSKGCTGDNPVTTWVSPLSLLTAGHSQPQNSEDSAVTKVRKSVISQGHRVGLCLSVTQSHMTCTPHQAPSPSFILFTLNSKKKIILRN